MKRKLAFAFIELLVDLALVVILVGLIIPYYENMKMTVDSRVARREIRIIKIAVRSYYENQKPNAYPPTTDNLCADYLLKAKLQIVKNILHDPFVKTKQEYHYAVSSNGKYYCIWTIGMNRKSDIQGIDDEGNVVKDVRCDDLYATPNIDPPS